MKTKKNQEMDDLMEVIRMRQLLLKMKGEMEAYLKLKRTANYLLRTDLEHCVSAMGRIIEFLNKEMGERPTG